MAISEVYVGGWDQSFADENSSPGAAIDHGTGSHRYAIALTGYQGGTQNAPDTFTVGADSFTAEGSTYTDGGGDKWRVFTKLLTVTGNQTPVLHFAAGTYGGGGAARCAYLIIQSGDVLTIGNLLAVLGQFAGGGGGNLSQDVSGASGDTLYMLGHSSDSASTGFSGTMLTSAATGKSAVKDTSAGSPNTIGITVGAFGSYYSTGFSVTEGTPATNYILVAEQDSYALFGQNAGLNASGRLTAAQGTYNITGQDTTLTYSSGPEAYSITSDFGTYNITGSDAEIDNVMTAAFGTYALTGQNATLTPVIAGGTTYTLTSEQGSYSITGQTALAKYSFVAAQGSYSLSGQDATLTYQLAAAINYSLTAAQGSYSYTGQDASFIAVIATPRTITAEYGQYTIDKRSANLRWSGAPINGNGLGKGRLKLSLGLS